MKAIVVADSPLEFRCLRDWPNVRFDEPGADAAGRDDATDKPGDSRAGHDDLWPETPSDYWP